MKGQRKTHPLLPPAVTKPSFPSTPRSRTGSSHSIQCRTALLTVLSSASMSSLSCRHRKEGVKRRSAHFFFSKKEGNVRKPQCHISRHNLVVRRRSISRRMQEEDVLSERDLQRRLREADESEEGRWRALVLFATAGEVEGLVDALLGVFG